MSNATHSTKGLHLATRSAHSCEMLGVCQGQPAQRGCLCARPPSSADRFPFAPGVIDVDHMTDRTRHADTIGKVALALVGAECIAAVAGFAVGYFNLPGVL